MKTMLSVFVAVFILFLTLVPMPVPAQQAGENGKVVMCKTNECMNGIKASMDRQLTKEEAARELCLTEGLTWKEEGVTYVLAKDEVIKDSCFKARWHTFRQGEAE